MANTNYTSSGKIGVNVGSTSTDAKFALGELCWANGGKAFVYVKASGAISQYDVVTFDETFDTVVAPLSTSNDDIADSVGVAPVAFASGDYGWLQIKGPCTMNVKASCAANVKINTTATAGSLDDDATAGAKTVLGCYLTTARGGTDGSAAGILHFPFIDATL